MKRHHNYILYLSIFLRLALFSYKPIQQVLVNRVEISSPISSYSRLIEGTFLIKNGFSPYTSDLFHYQPLVIFLFYPIIQFFGDFGVLCFLTVVDIITAFTLKKIFFFITYRYHLRMQHFLNTTSSSFISSQQQKDVSLSQSSFIELLPSILFSVFLLNPFTIFCTVGLSTSSLIHALTTITIYYACKHRFLLTTIFLGFSLYLELYSFLLFIPITLLLSFDNHSIDSDTHIIGKKEKHYSSISINFFLILSLVLLFLSLLFLVSYYLMNYNGEFLSKVYFFTLNLSDYTPNIGPFWYFFTQIFPRFRIFFLFLFHFHIITYIIPLSIRFQKEPLFLVMCIIYISSFYKPFPVINDSMYGMLWLAGFSPYLYQKTSLKTSSDHDQDQFISYFHPWVVLLSVMLSFFTISLGLSMWDIWINHETGNPNYYYVQTLLFIVSNSYLFLESVSAIRKGSFFE